MLALAIIKYFDVLEACGLHFRMCSVTLAMVPFVLETVKPALGRGVIPAISLPAHGANHAEFLELVLERVAGILATAVRVMHDTWGWPSAEPGHRQGVRHDIAGHARLE